MVFSIDGCLEIWSLGIMLVDVRTEINHFRGGSPDLLASM